MSEKEYKLTIDRLHQVLDYNQETGVFIWKHRDRCKDTIGQVATKSHMYEYLGISIDNVRYPAHRLAWFYVFGKWPKMIDHVNGCKTDNRIINLRSVVAKTNTQNIRKATKRNVTGLLGVYLFNGKYKSCIRVNEKTVHLGTFASKESAHEAYLIAKRTHHIGCTI
jgi:hypothetical protein